MSAYPPDNIDSAIRNLNDLLDIICYLQFDQGEQRDHRIDSLLWIARDLSVGIVAGLSKETEDGKC